MIPTYTQAIKEKIIKDYFGGNLVVLLINNNNLGITDTPSSTQLEARQNYSTNNLINNEIGGTNLNGYQRQIIPNNTINPIKVSTTLTKINLSVSFQADNGDFDPFTHIVVLRGANLTNANTNNGNNRGDTSGTIIFIEPVDNINSPGSPFILQQNVVFNYNFSLLSSDDVI